MIIVVKQGTDYSEIQALVKWLEGKNVRTHVSTGDYQTIIGLIGNTGHISADEVLRMNGVQSVKRISDPFKRANRDFHPQDTIVTVREEGPLVGHGHFGMIAGPCSVESEEQIIGIARAVKEAGANMLRGGAFKPRTSPYDFQGLKAEGIELLREAKAETGLPIVTEIMNANHIPLFEDVDVIQVGARNMQNFELLKELGQLRKPILLKRGLANSIKEWLMSAEYIMAGGNENVILCERGIRTFETATRNTLDLSAVAVLKEKTHLPVVVDPSHATGVARYVRPMAMAAAACGADGLIIEVHNDPAHALCDGPQSLLPEEFAEVAGAVRAVRIAAGACK